MEKECQSIAYKYLLCTIYSPKFYFYLVKDSLFFAYVGSEVQSKIRHACSILQIFAATS